MVKNTLKKLAGVVLVVYGLLALATPFTPGAWLIFVGAELLGLELLILEKPIAFVEQQIGGKRLKWFRKQLKKLKSS